MTRRHSREMSNSESDIRKSTSSHNTNKKRKWYLPICGAVIVVVAGFAIASVVLAAPSNESGLQATTNSVVSSHSIAADISSIENPSGEVPDVAKTPDTNAISDEQAVVLALRWLESFNEDTDFKAFEISAVYWGHPDPAHPDPSYIPTWVVYFKGSAGTSLWVPAYSGFMEGENYGYGYQQLQGFDLEGYLNNKGTSARVDDQGRLFDLLDFNSPTVLLIAVNDSNGEVGYNGYVDAKPTDRGVLTEEDAISYAVDYLSSFPYGNEVDWNTVKATATLNEYPGPANFSTWVIAFETDEPVPFWDVTGPGILSVYINAYSGQVNGNSFSPN